MTDEQIIIDGVDVRGCCFFETHYTEDEDVEIKHFCKIFHYYCETEPNCNYKQLKRKEQECEELKQRLQQCWKVEYSFVEQLDQLKAENGHLSEKEKEARHYLKEAEKFKNCLTEIEEIAENGKRFAERYMITGEQKANVLTYANAILQKISEVENV